MKFFALLLPLLVRGTELTNGDVVKAENAAFEVHKASYVHVQNKWFNLKQDTSKQMRSFSPLGVAAACTTAFQALETTMGTCMNTTNIGQIFEDNNGMSPTDVQTAVDGYCADGACAAQIMAAMVTFKTACIDSNELSQMCAGMSNQPGACAAAEICHAPLAGTCVLNRQFFANVAAMTQLPCMEGPDGNGGTKYCIPSFYQFVQPFDDAGATDAQLETRLANGCDECTLKVFKAWSHFEPFEAGLHFMVLSTACIKRKGEFCAVKWKQAQEYDNANPQCEARLLEAGCNADPRGCKWDADKPLFKCEEKWTQEKLAKGCHPCMFAFLRRMAFITAALQQIDPQPARAQQLQAIVGVAIGLRFLCTSDFENKFCLAKIENTQYDLDGGADGPKCDQFAGFVKEQGCCAGTFVNVVKFLCAVQRENPPAGGVDAMCQPGAIDAGITQLQDACKDSDPWELPEGCGVQKYKIVAAAVIQNIRRTWWENNKEALKAYVIATIAYNAGVDEETIKDVVISETAPAGARRLLAEGDLYVSYGADVGGDSEVTSIQDGMGEDGNELENYELAKVDAEGLDDPTAAIKFVSNGVDVTVTNPDKAMSPACAAVPSALAFAGLVMA